MIRTKCNTSDDQFLQYHTIFDEGEDFMILRISYRPTLVDTFFNPLYFTMMSGFWCRNLSKLFDWQLAFKCEMQHQDVLCNSENLLKARNYHMLDQMTVLLRAAENMEKHPHDNSFQPIISCCAES